MSDDNLYRRGDTWYGRIQVCNRDLRKSLRTASKAEAKKRLKAWTEELNHAAFYGEARYTYKAAVGRWMTEVIPQSVKPRTAERYKTSIRMLEGYFADRYVDEITRKFIAGFVSARKQQKATNATIRRDLTALSSVLRACIAWGWREDNPARDFERSIIRERRDPIILPTEEEIAAIVGEAPRMFGLLIRFIEQTGLREKEATGLERQSVDIPNRRLTLTRTKTNRPRVVPLDDKITSQAVGTYAGTVTHISSPYVFWHDDGEPYLFASSQFGAIRRRINAARRKEKLPEISFSLHDLRHKFAVDYLRAGGGIYTLQKILGHSSIKTTEIYLDYLTPDERQQTMNAPAQMPAQI